MEVDGAALTFVVSDNGRGIAREDLRGILQPVHESAGQPKDSDSTIGLGNVVSHALAGQAGGSLRIVTDR
jgi:C4-dicarboxylate-specific signal transduction histidine kinase